MNDKIQELLDKAEAQANASSSVSRAEKEFASAKEAEKIRARLRTKLFHVNRWNAHSALTSFALFDESGKECEREAAAAGDFIRLTLAASGKNDWVKITRITNAPDETILTVRPTYDPTENEPDEKITSHFFTSDSTNNFCLQRQDEKIIFYVIGLDEKTNTANTKNVLETVRNAATANLGHYLGIQEFEWQQFCENFLDGK